MSGVLIHRLKDKFSEFIIETHSFRGDETVTIKKEALLEVCAFLRDELKFEFLIDLTVVDYLEREPRFEVVYHFYSLENNYRLRVKATLSESDPAIDSLMPLWAGANWFEREAYDMFGIKFKGHPDLRRILMYDGFEGYPLRKDYPLRKRQPRIPHPD